MAKLVEDLLDPGQGESGTQAGDQLYRAMKAGLVDPAQRSLRPRVERSGKAAEPPITHVKTASRASRPQASRAVTRSTRSKKPLPAVSRTRKKSAA